MAGFDGFKLPVSRRAARSRRLAEESQRASVGIRGSLLSHDGTNEHLTAGDQAAVETDAVDGDRSSKRGPAAASAAGVRLPDRLPFSKTDILFVCFSIVTFLADIATDVKLAHSYYAHGDWLFFSLTLGFFVLSGVVSSAFSMYWYVFDHRATRVHLAPDELPSKGAWLLRILCAVLLIAPVLRHIDIIRYGLKSRWGKRTPEQRERYFREMQYERVDGAMLRLFECFVEDAPQLVLQLYVVLSKGFPSSTDQVTWTLVFQAASIVTSLISLAWGLVAYHKALRYSRVDRCVLSHTGFVLQFFWRLFEVAPRVLAFAVFMLAHQYWLGVLIGCHWVAMAAWLLAIGSKFCPRLRLELLFVLVVAAVWVFCHFNIKDGATRRRYVIYYTIVYIENALMAALWYASVDGAPLATQWHKDIVLPIILCSFWVSLFFMIIYYYYFHPNRPLPVTQPCSYWLVCDGRSRSSQQSNDYVDSKKGPPSAHMLSEIGVTVQPANATDRHRNGVNAAGEAADADDAFMGDTSALLPSQSPVAGNAGIAEDYVGIASLPATPTQQPLGTLRAVVDDPPLSAAGRVEAAGESAAHLLGSRPTPEPVVFEPIAIVAGVTTMIRSQTPAEPGDAGYLKPLPDGTYVEPIDNRLQPIDDGDDGSSPVPPAYEAPGLPTVVVAEDNDVPVYRAPALPGTAAADDLSDMPAYHAPIAPSRPWSAAIDLDDRVGGDFRSTAWRPRSAVVDMRYSDRPPLLVALPSAAGVISRPRNTDALLASFDSGAGDTLAEAAKASTSARESSPKAAAAPRELTTQEAIAAAAHQPLSLFTISVASSPVASDTAEQRSLLSPAADEQATCSSAADEPAAGADDVIACSIRPADTTADYLELHGSTPVSMARQSSHVRDALSQQTPDLRQHDFIRGDVLSRHRYDNEMLLTPDRIRLTMGSGHHETPSVVANLAGGAALHTPEARAREAAAGAQPLPSTPDGDLDLTPDRKLRAAGVGRIAYC